MVHVLRALSAGEAGGCEDQEDEKRREPSRGSDDALQAPDENDQGIPNLAPEVSLLSVEGQIRHVLDTVGRFPRQRS